MLSGKDEQKYRWSFSFAINARGGIEKAGAYVKPTVSQRQPAQEIQGKVQGNGIGVWDLQRSARSYSL